MKLIPTAALLLVLAAPAFAASPVKTLPGDITLAQAQAVVRSAQAKAEAINVPMNIAVVDAGGNLKAFARMDDAFLGSIDIAERKARTARYFNMSTRALGQAAQATAHACPHYRWPTLSINWRCLPGWMGNSPPSCGATCCGWCRGCYLFCARPGASAIRG